jgi:undecaprenyl pyrophosphate phosphatase UppP
MLELLEGIFLGIMQGPTEFLPASSRGHLLLVSTGLVSANLVGCLAIRFLLRFLANHSLKAFPYYCLASAVLVATALLPGS